MCKPFATDRNVGKLKFGWSLYAKTFRGRRVHSVYILKSYTNVSLAVFEGPVAIQMTQYGSMGVCVPRQQGKQARSLIRSSLLNRKLMMGFAPAWAKLIHTAAVR